MEIEMENGKTYAYITILNEHYFDPDAEHQKLKHKFQHIIVSVIKFKTRTYFQSYDGGHINEVISHLTSS
jgi:hypothetical protein